MKLILYLIIFFIFFFVVLVRYVEKSNIYFPMKEITATPELAGLSYEEVYFDTSSGERLNGWFIPADKAKFTILFCHGNAGNISHRIDKAAMFYDLGINMLVFDYRGYGKSSGSPSESGLYEDAGAAYRYLTERRKIPKDTIVLYGESLGGAVAIDLAQKTAVQGLITEETFTSIPDMSRLVYPFIPSFVISTKFDSTDKIKKVRCSKLIIHSIDDEITPFYMGEKLFAEAPPPKKLLKIRGTHNTAFLDSREQFTKGIKSFLEDLQ